MTAVAPTPAAVPDDMRELIERMAAVMKVQDPDEEFQGMRRELGSLSCGYASPGAVSPGAPGEVFDVSSGGHYANRYWVKDVEELESLCARAEARLASFTIRTSGRLQSLVELLVDSKFRKAESLRAVADESATGKEFNLEAVRAYARLMGATEQVTISFTRGVVLMFRCGEDEAVRRVDSVRELKPTPFKVLAKMATTRLSVMMRADKEWRKDSSVSREVKDGLQSPRRENLAQYVRNVRERNLFGSTGADLQKKAHDVDMFLQRPDVEDLLLDEAFRLLAVEEVMGS